MVSVVRVVTDRRSFEFRSGVCDANEGVFGKGIPFRDVSSGKDGDKRELGHGGEGSS